MADRLEASHEGLSSVVCVAMPSVSSSQCVALDGRMVIESIERKRTTVVSFSAPFLYSPGRSEEIHKRLLSEYSVSLLRFELSAPGTQARNLAA